MQVEEVCTKQAAKQWYLKIQSCMEMNGFVGCEADKCVFMKEDKGMISVIAIYVDDLIIACKSSIEMKSIIAFLKRSSSIKELRNAQYCLGIKIERDRNKNKCFKSKDIH
jgi:hypothetical protein